MLHFVSKLSLNVIIIFLVFSLLLIQLTLFFSQKVRYRIKRISFISSKNFGLISILPTIVIIFLFFGHYIYNKYVMGVSYYNSTHDLTYFPFGIASIVGCIAAIFIYFTIKEKLQDASEVRELLFDILNDASETSKAYVLLASPNPGHYRYKDKVRSDPERKYNELYIKLIKAGSNNAKEPILNLACLPWVEDFRINKHDNVILNDSDYANDAQKRLTIQSKLLTSSMGKFLSYYYERDGGEDENSYMGHVVDLILEIKKLVGKNIVKLFWLASLANIETEINNCESIKELIIILSTKKRSYFGTYGFNLKRGFDLVNIGRAQESIHENLFEILLKTYGGKQVRWK